MVFGPKTFFSEITSMTAELDGFWPEDLFFEITCSHRHCRLRCAAEFTVTSLISVPQVKKGCGALL